MAEDADHTDHLTRFTDMVWDVTRVANELLTTSHLQWERDSNDVSLLAKCIWLNKP